MTVRVDDQRLLRLRLAAQRLTPATAASDPRAAASTVVGIQAQDVRAAGLALRSRVPGLERAEIDAGGLVRTWTVRGTVHLVDEDDLPWLWAVTAPRNRKRFDRLMEKRGNLDLARSMLGDIVSILEQGPRHRAPLLAELAARRHEALGPYSVNIVMAWAAAQGVVAGLADGRFRAADPPAAVDEEEALATLARRYLTGYGPASRADLAHWSGLPLGAVRRGLATLGELETSGDLFALPGTLDGEPPPAPPALLLAAFDTVLLGYRSREPLVARAEDRRILPGGGMLRPVALVDGAASGTWRLEGSGRRRSLAIDWFGPRTAPAALGAEGRDVARFLGIELRPD